MAPAYKLTYFNIRGAAEPVRLLFAYGGIEYEDVRIAEQDWPEFKSKTLYGQLPVLEHEGKVINQSKAISRYVAKKVKLYGQDDWEDVEIDAMIDNFHDLLKPFIALRHEADKEKAKAQFAEHVKTTLPFYLERFEKSVKNHGGFLASNRMTLADVCFATFTEMIISRAGPEVLSKYPSLVAVREKVLAVPNIKKWVETRPKTDN